MSDTFLEKPIEYQVNGEEVKLTGNMVKNFLVSGNAEVSDQEIVMFLQLCKYQKLNPFLNEAYLVKYKNKKGGPDAPAQIIVSKEAFMKRAESHSEYNGLEAGIIVERGEEIKELEGAIKLSKDKLIGGWAKVYRKDREIPTTAKISFAEFSKGQSTWDKMPGTMIRKTAIVNALREAFPQDLGAMFTEEDKAPFDQSVRQEPKPSPANSIFEEKVNQAAKEQPEVIDAAAEDVSPEEVQDEVAGK